MKDLISYPSYIRGNLITQKFGQPDHRNDFRFEIISNHRDPFERQVTEAVRIERALQAGLMMSKEGKEIEVSSLNRRFEHFCPRVRPENLGAGGGQ